MYLAIHGLITAANCGKNNIGIATSTTASETGSHIQFSHALNSLRPSDAIFQVMACCLFSPKPLPEPVVTYCHLDI